MARWLGAFLVLLQLVAATSARAQCGARLSQCRNCHEIAGARPVLASAAPWHRDHAFGDFCVQCHMGDPESTDKTQAHARVTSPLAAIELSCGPCHPNDAATLADRYLKQPPVAPSPVVRAARASSSAGNLVLAGLVVVVGAGGGGYVVRNERRLRAPAKGGPVG